MTVPLISLTWTDERPAILGDTELLIRLEPHRPGWWRPHRPRDQHGGARGHLVTSLALIALIAAWIFITWSVGGITVFTN